MNHLQTILNYHSKEKKIYHHRFEVRKIESIKSLSKMTVLTTKKYGRVQLMFSTVIIV